MLCHPCQSIFSSERSQMGMLVQGSFHAVSFHGIQKSGRAGCALCAQLFRKLKDEFPQQDLDQSFQLSKYRLYYKLVEHLGDPERLTLSFQLAVGSNCVDAASESSDRDVAETTSLHQFHVASYKSETHHFLNTLESKTNHSQASPIALQSMVSITRSPGAAATMIPGNS